MLMNVFGEYKIDWNGVRQDEASGHLLCVAKSVAYAYQSFLLAAWEATVVVRLTEASMRNGTIYEKDAAKL